MTGGVATGAGDRGLPAERTFLAYGRTQLVGVVAALLVAHDAHTGDRHRLAVAIAVAAVLVICVAGGLRQRRLLRPSPPDGGTSSLVTAITAGVVLLQAAAILIVL